MDHDCEYSWDVTTNSCFVCDKQKSKICWIVTDDTESPIPDQRPCETYDEAMTEARRIGAERDIDTFVTQAMS